MFLVLLAAAVIFISYALTRGFRVNARPLIVLGSGGHTGEMLTIASRIRWSEEPHFVYGAGDTLSVEKARGAGFMLAGFSALPRARRVGESLPSALISSVKTLVVALSLVWRLAPSLILCNGPGTGVIVILAARLLRLRTRVIYVESLARVKTLSLSGKLLYNLQMCDRFIVQWPELVRHYPGAEHVGLLV